jgi:hypothetical protein
MLWNGTTDQGNHRVIIVNRAKKIVWQYGKTGAPGVAAGRLNNPNSAEMLPNGHVLISDESNNRVIEVIRSNKHIAWQYGSPNATSTLNAPAFASRLPNGTTLISDSANNRIVEVTKAKKVVWVYPTNTRAGSVTDPIPTRAVRLRNGWTLISDQFNHQVIAVTRAKQIVWKYGTVGVAGASAGMLNAPYDAKSVGDYTGLTEPKHNTCEHGRDAAEGAAPVVFAAQVGSQDFTAAGLSPSNVDPFRRSPWAG